MKYWLDTEFIEDGKTIDLISIGIVAEDGREFYAESLDCDAHKASDWVKENVFPHLMGGVALMHRDLLAYKVLEFCDPNGFGKPEFWGYYADYDWVVFCQLFGRMIDLPKGFPMYCRDIKQMCDDMGKPELPKQESSEHHALADARWNKQAYEFLCAKAGAPK